MPTVKKRRMAMRQGARRGYTVVELMMAITIFAIGVTGVLAMQMVIATSNTHSKNVAVATQLARSWQEQLAMDALQWGGEFEWNILNTRWVQQVVPQPNAWFLPLNNTAGTFGPGANALGGFVDFTSAPQQDVVFCTHIRLTPLFDEAGSQVLRSEVRVFWPKGETAWNAGAPYCNLAANANAIGAATQNFHFVYETSAVRETPAF